MVMRGLASEFRKNELSLASGHFGILMCLSQQGPLNLSDLAERLEVSLPTMSNSVSTLAGRGWVARQRDPGDRRVALVTLTEEGRQVLRKIGIQAQKHVSRSLVYLSEEECRQLLVGLRRLRESYLKAFEEDEGIDRSDRRGSCL